MLLHRMAYIRTKRRAHCIPTRLSNFISSPYFTAIVVNLIFFCLIHKILHIALKWCGRQLLITKNSYSNNFCCVGFEVWEQIDSEVSLVMPFEWDLLLEFLIIQAVTFCLMAGNFSGFVVRGHEGWQKIIFEQKIFNLNFFKLTKRNKVA